MPGVGGCCLDRGMSSSIGTILDAATGDIGDDFDDADGLLREARGVAAPVGRGAQRSQAARSRAANSANVVAGRPVNRRTARLGRAETFQRTTRWIMRCTAR